MKAIRLLTVLLVALQASSLWAQQQGLPSITMSAGIGARASAAGPQGLGPVTLDCTEIFRETGTVESTGNPDVPNIFESGQMGQTLGQTSSQ